MARITDLPCEIVVAVYRQLGHIRFLLPCVLTCRHLYYSYKAYPSLGIEFLVHQVSRDLLPYSIAAYKVSHSPTPYTRLTILELLRTLNHSPQVLIDRLRDYPLIALVKIEQTHNQVEKYINVCEPEAWRLTAQPAIRPRLRVLTRDGHKTFQRQQFSFKRAFYRFQLYARFFRGISGRLDQQIELFFSDYLPSENRHLIRICDYLDQHVIQVAEAEERHQIEFPAGYMVYMVNSWLYDREHVRWAIELQKPLGF
ncbi:hypothetical protein F5B22DRAFT_645527 [Xylaria bambusicola]|uniref:uncharacterized protein n=1 Tax=Xylaria bambusicola TaxID=326684 RepID=UPI002007E141|nr:uncharacterized protein F5B22DRAFT_645527 [Xylaria bambusicola]KAI0517823.1 hypothetical protein F5B22DRAFT_645527 [Xylaria bambusicola]